MSTTNNTRYGTWWFLIPLYFIVWAFGAAGLHYVCVAAPSRSPIEAFWMTLAWAEIIGGMAGFIAVIEWVRGS